MKQTDSFEGIKSFWLQGFYNVVGEFFFSVQK